MAPQTELDIPSKSGLFLGHFEFLFNSKWDYCEKQVIPIFLGIKIGETDNIMLVEISCFVVFQAIFFSVVLLSARSSKLS